jgi:tRNA dimethylallyltransferase
VQAIGLAGPTAAGKTASALAIADALPVEIVSVDSALVYRGMDIGTAKPGAAERARVPHHLIDLLDPAEAYSAALFVADARRLVAEIAARGRIALLVGGTMLYFKALTEGLDALPAAELARVDPSTAARLPPGDTQRIQRALEVWRATGRPLSQWQRGAAADARARLPLPLISLEPRERAWLHTRIAERFRAMLDAGFVDEVRRLRARGDLHAGLPSMRSVGYRQAWTALDEGRLDTLAERGIAATRQLAKRQLTWLRGMPQRHVIACDDAAAVSRVVDAARTLAAGAEP